MPTPNNTSAQIFGRSLSPRLIFLYRFGKVARLEFFAALDTKTGTVIGKCYRRQRATEFMKFLRMIDASVKEYLEANNASPPSFVWTKSADAILDSLKRFCRRTSESAR